MKTTTRYYMVHRAGTTTHVMHPTLEKARAEATRLAMTAPGCVFNVMAVVDSWGIVSPTPTQFPVVSA